MSIDSILICYVHIMISVRIYIYISVVNEYTSHRHISILTGAFKQFPFPTACFFPTAHFCHRFRLRAITFALCRSPFILPSDSALFKKKIRNGMWFMDERKKRHDFSSKGKDRKGILQPSIFRCYRCKLLISWRVNYCYLQSREGIDRFGCSTNVMVMGFFSGTKHGRGPKPTEGHPFLMHKTKSIQEFSIETPNWKV